MVVIVKDMTRTDKQAVRIAIRSLSDEELVTEAKHMRERQKLSQRYADWLEREIRRRKRHARDAGCAI